jgi:hypothetical protein
LFFFFKIFLHFLTKRTISQRALIQIVANQHNHVEYAEKILKK